MTKGTLLRNKALSVLLGLEENGFSPDPSLYSDIPDKRDRAFIKQLTEGVTERRITIDHVIDRFSAVKTGKQKKVIRNVLRLGVYQILFMDSVPGFSAVNESVKLVKARRMGSLSGFVNAVLRKVADEGFDLSKEDFSIRYSMPEWITDLLIRELGEERAEAALKSFLEPRPVYIRANTSLVSGEELKKRLGSEGIMVSEVPGLADSLIIEDFGDMRELKSFKDGLFSVQDLSSQHIGWEIREILKDKGPGSFQIMDVSAAPGGKSCHAAEALKSLGFKDSSVLSVDVSEKRTELIRENAKRLKLDNIETLTLDARELKEKDKDLIIADLPCSGLGVMGRKSSIKYRVKEEDIGALRALQREILSASVPALKKNGILIFSVCTFDREETVVQRDWIRETFGMEVIKEKLFVPGEGREDGFYYVVMCNG